MKWDINKTILDSTQIQIQIQIDIRIWHQTVSWIMDYANFFPDFFFMKKLALMK
jgi:hypothetical protein